VEFDNKYQATFAMNNVQGMAMLDSTNSMKGYRFEKDDAKGLSMSYAKTERKTKPSTRYRNTVLSNVRGDGRPKMNTQRSE